MTIAVQHREVVECVIPKMNDKIHERRRTSPVPIQQGSGKPRARASQAKALSNEEEKSPFMILPRGAQLQNFSVYQSPQSLPLTDRKNNRSPPLKQKTGFTSCNHGKTTDYSSPNSASSSDETRSENSYAGARFHSPPAATVLPKPPSHWMNDKALPTTAFGFCFQQTISANAMSAHIKGILKVPIQA